MKDIIISGFVLFACFQSGVFTQIGELSNPADLRCNPGNKSDRVVMVSVSMLPSNAADKKNGRQGRVPSSAEKEEDDELTSSKRYQPVIQDLLVLTLVLAVDYLNNFYKLRHSTFRFLKAGPDKQYILLRVFRL
ncbi:MAG: hypothetical protein JST14_12355 [Bacteroidetes bacterium]|nr:hypothetical protein [Bacteroidota bacterium]